ncbi:MAG: hypothetical protein KF773_39405 [Deltaproteobacteria bacterium]|nr:hypothetical protein [Deltaproteobacteria bacterium]MCW5806711.1 hypothetical protein [Deltaproteobacteria bacterium]
MSRFAGCAAALVGLAAVARPAAGDGELCEVLDVELMAAQAAREPAFQFPLQMVGWLETASGTFVDTVFLTREVSTFGLGNRPGRFDFASGPKWPYGRRTTVFPVWAHRHGLEFPEVVFQDGDDNALSHAFNLSSMENHYCRPIRRDEGLWDSRTCASPSYTDKGKLGSGTSKYPPRRDLVRLEGDDASIEMYQTLNPFDGVTTATPAPNVLHQVSWPAPDGLPPGDYVLWVEVAREFDHNATYSVSAYPKPAVSYGEYGEAYRGQPSVVYKVPLSISATDTTATTMDYVGYGDPDGLDGNVRAPDSTITSDLPGSGALRLALVSDGGDMFRVRVKSHQEVDTVPPNAVGNLAVDDVTSGAAALTFIAPGDDGDVGRVRRYDVRFRILDDDPANAVTEANFDVSPQLPVDVAIADANTPTSLKLERLLPSTHYSIGIRAIDNCRNASPVAVVDFQTLERKVGQVDWCFIATAAYGSAMATDVERLRSFRDRVLRQTILGELAVSTYYTFSPVLASTIGESELLRASARGFLRPIVDRLRGKMR